MLSKRMAKVLTGISYTSMGGQFHDLRTIRALQKRSLIKAVKFHRGINTYTFTLTKRGKKVSRQLTFLDKSILKEILS